MRRFLLPFIPIFIFTIQAYSQIESDSIEFKWDFQNTRNLNYTYSLETNAAVSFDKDEKPNNEYINTTGLVKIKPKSNDLADIYLVSQKFKTVEKSDTLIEKIQDIIIQGLNTNGTFQNQFHNPTFDLLFSLPTEKMKMNDSQNVQMKMLFLADGSSLEATGFNEFVFSDLNLIKNKWIATLSSKFDISDLGLEGEFEDKYVYETRGTGRYLFDVTNGNLISAEIHFSIKTKINTLNQNKDFGMYGFSEQTGTLELKLVNE